MSFAKDIRQLRRNPHIVVASLLANTLGLALPLVMIQIYDRVIPRAGLETLTVLMLGLFLAAAAEFAVRLARGRLLAVGSLQYDDYAHDEAIKRMLQFGALSQPHDRGSDSQKFESIERVRRAHSGDAATALLDVPFIVMFIGVMALISPLMGAAICLLASASFIVVWLQRRRILKDNEARHDRDRRRHSFLMETLDGIDMVKSLGIEQMMQRRYEKLMAGSALTTHALTSRVNYTQGISAAMGLVAPVLMCGIGSVLVITGQMTMGGLAATVLLTSRVIQPTMRIEALLAGQRDVKRSEKDVVNLTSGQLLHLGQQRFPKIEEITLQDVSLAVGAGKDPVQKGLSTTLRRGDCVLLDGQEGSGRTLFLSLLAGHIPHTEGTLLVNGVPVEDVSGTFLSEKISLLTSQYTMLDGTLLENMTAFDVERYTKAAFALAEEMGISGFITRHADGLSLQVASGRAVSLPKSIHDGVLLISGLVRQPDVILFDEANTGLDRQTDLRLIEILRRRIPDSIIVMVTHRPSYKALANRMLTLDKNGLQERDVPLQLRQVAS